MLPCKGSGGDGQYRGGNGVIRDIEFLEDGIEVSILSERRVFRPYGLKGGEDGLPGLNLWIRRVGDKVQTLNLSGKNTAIFGKGDRIVIQTPGGGGYGCRKDDATMNSSEHSTYKRIAAVKAGGSLGAYRAMSESA